MQCGICERDSQRICCAACARHTLWPIRYDTILRASERSVAEAQVNEYLTGKVSHEEDEGKKPTVIDGREVKRFRAESEEAKINIARIMEENEKVKAEIEEARKQIAALREQNNTRSSLFKEHSKGLDEKRAMALDSIQRETKRTRQKWNLAQNRAAEARSYLCYEAASLYGLKQRRRRGTVEYLIGGNLIPSLHDLATHPPILTTATFGNLCALLMLISDYCGIKLPFEVTLPGKQNQHPTIKAPSQIRPRHLHLDVSLTDLFRDQSSNYVLFLEGASMLAYDVAWLCLTQGLEITDIDAVMHPGKNLFQLLIGGGQGPSTGFGRWSHATTGAGFLGGKEGTRLTREWSVDYREIVKKLETVVHGQNMKLEWDLVEEVVGEDEEETFSGLENKATAASGGRRASIASRLSVGSKAAIADTSGWTKVPKARTKS